MRTPGRNTAERLAILARRSRIATMAARGERNRERLVVALAAEGIKVDERTVSRDLKAIEQEWRERYLGPIDDHKSQIIAELEAAKLELWAAWERSRKPRERFKGKTVSGQAKGKGADAKPAGREEKEKVTEGRDGNPRFLAEIREIDHLIAKIKGMIITKVAPVTPDGDKPAVLKIEVVQTGPNQT